MTYGEIKAFCMFQINEDAEDMSDFLPAAERYIESGYDLLINAWEPRKHVGDAEYPALQFDTDRPILPDWTHQAIGDYATYLLYRNGGLQRQQRGREYLDAFYRVFNKVLSEGGKAGKARDRFVNLYTPNRYPNDPTDAATVNPYR
ncbi:hypothetical protein FACS1894196_5000 [Clostridia bacterium]|nr:hypothetical protein FACS1894196_5000 [Clostridia bacterium]